LAAASRGSEHLPRREGRHREVITATLITATLITATLVIA
jgi:hypothetical protein